MISNLSPSQDLFLANVNRIEQNLATANQQISSGKKVTVPSDAPSQVSNLLQLGSDRQRNTQIQSNLSMAKTDAEAADSALSNASNLMDSAVQLATEGANATQTADTRQSMAAKAEALLTEMVAYSQTQVQGRYIFSGDQDQNAAYQVDLAAAGGVDQLYTAGATGQIENPAGGTFAAAKTAQAIFGKTNPDGTPASDNVFAALAGLRTALLNNDQAGCAAAVTSIQQAAQNLRNMDAFYGTVESRIDDASSFATKYDIQLQSEIGNIQDVDAATAAMELTQATTQLQAAFQMEAKIPTSSLFNYLG